jgi:hypothetical protein
MVTKFPATVMVLGVVSNESDVMPSHFFEKGPKLNAQEYLKVMQDVVKPWMDRVANGRDHIFQQDGTPAHNTKVPQEWCEANLPEFWSKEIWPPSSPDCNPLECLRERCQQEPPQHCCLKAKITEVIANYPRTPWPRPAGGSTRGLRPWLRLVTIFLNNPL